MKQFLLKTMMLLCMLFVGMGAWAETVEFGWGDASENNFTAVSGDINGILSFSTAKESAANAPAYNSNSNQLRLYYNSGGKGGSITLTPATGVTFSEIVITSATNPTVKYYVDGSSTGSTASKTGSSNQYTYTITTSVSSSIKIQNANTTNTQLQISKISVTYSKGSTKTLSSIAVKTAPTKTTYTEGEFFNPAGLVVTKTYDDASTVDVEYSKTPSAFSFNPGLTTALQTSNTSVSITVDSKNTNQAITVNALPTHTAHFSVNGTINNGDNQVVKEGQAITFPADPADINGKTFMGWTKTADYSNAAAAPSDICRAANMGNADVTYYAVFATKETSGVEVVPGTVVVSWPIENVAKDGSLSANVGTGTLSPSFVLGSANAYTTNGTAGNDTYVLLSGLDLSAYSAKTLKMTFISRASGTQSVTISYKNAGDAEFTELTTTKNLTTTEEVYTINNIPSTAKTIKVKYNGTSGSFFFGSCRISTVETGSYQFEKVTASNTEDWTGADWNGYYLITNGSTNAFDGNAVMVKGYAAVTDVDGVITMANVEAAFKVEYTDGQGYSFKGIGANKFLATASSSCSVSDDPVYYKSIGYDHLKDATSGTINRLRYNAGKFAFYTSDAGSAPTLYRINSTTTISDYCTTVAIPTTVDVTIGATGYATFVAPYNMDFEGTTVTAFLVNPNVENNVVHMTSVDKVPAGTALVVKGTTASVPTIATAAPVTTALEVSATATDYDNVNTYYYLGVDNGEVGFRPLAEGGSIAAGKCFFKVPVSGAAPRFFSMSFGEATAIKTVENATSNAIRYNLAGQRVNANAKGIIIVNGKKMLNK